MGREIGAGGGGPVAFFSFLLCRAGWGDSDVCSLSDELLPAPLPSWWLVPLPHLPDSSGPGLPGQGWGNIGSAGVAQR